MPRIQPPKYAVGEIFSNKKKGRTVMFIQTENGREYLAHYNFKQKWGHEPTGRLEFRDGDNTNCHWMNLRDCKAEPKGRNYKRYLKHEPHFKTKPLDLKDKVLVRIDRKTWVYRNATI